MKTINELFTYLKVMNAQGFNGKKTTMKMIAILNGKNENLKSVLKVKMLESGVDDYTVNFVNHDIARHMASLEIKGLLPKLPSNMSGHYDTNFASYRDRGLITYNREGVKITKLGLQYLDEPKEYKRIRKQQLAIQKAKHEGFKIGLQRGENYTNYDTSLIFGRLLERMVELEKKYNLYSCDMVHDQDALFDIQSELLDIMIAMSNRSRRVKLHEELPYLFERVKV
tara:strand:- start:109 stop:786 length:678 start_codon:yes stop_codon:yes gene_type:complete